jgi:HPt (histidine-containing phosphotransfer) domain-containing protein
MSEQKRSEQKRFSMEELASEYADAPEVLEEIVEIFVEESPGRLERLRTAHAAGDREAMAEWAHKLANTTGAVHAEAAREPATKVEAICRGSCEDDLNEWVEKLVGEVRDVLEQIQDWRQARPADPPRENV